jgi:hypothetical protein
MQGLIATEGVDIDGNTELGKAVVEPGTLVGIAVVIVSELVDGEGVASLVVGTEVGIAGQYVPELGPAVVAIEPGIDTVNGVTHGWSWCWNRNGFSWE